MSDRSHLAGVWFEVTGLDVVSGSGCMVTTADGDEYLDFTSGIAVTSTGHCHPEVVAAVQEQAGRFIHAQVNVYRHDLLEPLAARLADLAPGAIDTFFLANSGAEATEAAVKLARQATGRTNLVVFEGSFHGRTAQTMAMTTSKTVYRAGHQPLPAGVFVAPFPTPARTGETADAATTRCLAAFDRLLATQTAPSETAAVIIEPVLGEGGYVPAPGAFLQGLADRCRDYDLLFVADEVQTGFARTGTMFAVEPSGIEPDVIILAKGMGSGFPISGIGASAALMEKWPVGSHGGTYGGNPLGCAAAIATIDVLSAPGFLDAVRDRGEQLRAGLEKLQAEHADLADIRGPGLMVGCEFLDADLAPLPLRAAAVIEHCRKESQVLLMSAGTDGNVVRWMPPLIASAAEIDRGLDAFAEALNATA